MLGFKRRFKTKGLKCWGVSLQSWLEYKNLNTSSFSAVLLVQSHSKLNTPGLHSAYCSSCLVLQILLQHNKMYSRKSPQITEWFILTLMSKKSPRSQQCVLYQVPPKLPLYRQSQNSSCKKGQSATCHLKSTTGSCLQAKNTLLHVDAGHLVQILLDFLWMHLT